jgi:predicted CXXCH cytochrome family protein
MLGARRDRVAGDEIKFSHAKHTDLPCESCHETGTTATALGVSMLPKEEVCLNCHSDEKDSKNCGFCHRDPNQPASYAPEKLGLKFPHAKHEKIEGACAHCHTKLVELDGARHPPTMAVCTSCHEHKQMFDDGRCEKCHVDLKSLKLKPETAFSHQAGFLKLHSVQARSSADTCATCHDQTFCADCHAKTVAVPIELKWSDEPMREFIHRDDYRSRHSLDARANPTSCQKCHGTSFCSSCHQAQTFTMSSGVGNGGAPHDPNQLMNPTQPGFHGRLVRQNAASCAACHDQGQQSNCVRCHSGLSAPNPHPPTFRNTHNRADIDNNPMCKYCHTEG